MQNIPPDEFSDFSTMDVTIRKYVESDIDPILEAVLESHQELSRWMHWCHAEYNREDAESWVHSRPAAWEKKEEWGFAIVDQHDRFLGTCGIHRIDLKNGVGEMGYWVRTSATGPSTFSAGAKKACSPPSPVGRSFFPGIWALPIKCTSMRLNKRALW